MKEVKRKGKKRKKENERWEGGSRKGRRKV